MLLRRGAVSGCQVKNQSGQTRKSLKNSRGGKIVREMCHDSGKDFHGGHYTSPTVNTVEGCGFKEKLDGLIIDPLPDEHLPSIALFRGDPRTR